MKIKFKLLLPIFAVAWLVSGCSQKVQIKALNPAEVGEMSNKKHIAVSHFRNDYVGLSGKIESQLAKNKLDGKNYFTVLSRKDMDLVLKEQKLQSSELLDEKTSARVGKLIGAQAIINGEVTASGEADYYYDDRKECVKYIKDSGCVKWHYYKVRCDTMQATVAANLNIVNIETGSLIYGDTLSRNYSADSCRVGRILSKDQAINQLASNIADDFVYKLTPNYVYFSVVLLEDIELDAVTDEQEEQFENSLLYIKAGRMDRADEILSKLMDEFDGKSYVVAYTYGVVKEAGGQLDEAKQLYEIADRETPKPVEEVNRAVMRINRYIDKRDEAKRQISVK
jgi:curli biogenesis system outer membrane secretion channel CsgG